jgi:hypothetical protein
MPVFEFTYDLVKPAGEFDYEPLWNELKRLDAHRTQYSAWLINLNNTAREVVEHFKQFVHNDDRLMAVRLRPGDYWYVNAMAGTNEWLKRNPPS